VVPSETTGPDGPDDAEADTDSDGPDGPDEPEESDESDDRSDFYRSIARSKHAQLTFDGELRCTHCGQVFEGANSPSPVHGHLPHCRHYDAEQSRFEFGGNSETPSDPDSDDAADGEDGTTGTAEPTGIPETTATADTSTADSDLGKGTGSGTPNGRLQGLRYVAVRICQAVKPGSGPAVADGEDMDGTGSTRPSVRSSAGLPDVIGRLQQYWNDRNERLAFAVGVVMVGIAACGGASFEFVIGLAVVAFGIEGVRDIEGARERLNQTGLFGLSPREQKGLIRTKPYQFIAGAAIGFVVTDLDLLTYVGLDTCRLLSAIGPLA
jgi:hypothetical protein